MIKKFVWWFFAFGLSFLIQHLGWAEQGVAFFGLHLGITLLILAIILIAGMATGDGITFLVLLISAFTLGITVLATWGATKLFDINFYIAFQVMTFGQCLVSNSKKKD